MIVGGEGGDLLLLGRALQFRLSQCTTTALNGAKRACNGLGHVSLDRQQILERSVVAVTPDVSPGRGVDQLGSDTRALGRGLQAAFKHVADAKVAPDLADIDRLVLVGRGRVAGDDEEVSKAGQIGDDVLRDPARKALFSWVAAEIFSKGRTAIEG